MKNKPVSHKEQNTFRFQTFSQQLANINIDVIHEVGKRNEAPEDADTFFYETLLKWDELNCTESYDSFKRCLPRDIHTLPQLILHEKEIVECLTTHLRLLESSCYHPLLELVVALARDLQSDFYEYFPEFFDILTKLLSKKDVELLQQVFKTISYIFKFLWRVIIKDVKKVFGLYSPLLGQYEPDYIRNYAAESIAFLLRKVPDKDELLNLIFSSLRNNPGLAKGIGQLLFEVIKGVQQNFHSSADKMLYLMFSKLGQGVVKHELVLPYDEIIVCQIQMVEAALDYTSRELSNVIWDSFMKILLELIENVKTESCYNRKEVVCHLERILKLLNCAVSFKNAKLALCSKVFLKMLISVINLDQLSDECGHNLMQIISSLLLSPHMHFDIATVNSFLLPVYSSDFSAEVKFSFTKKMYAYGMFEKDVMPPFLSFCQNIIVGGDEALAERVLLDLASMILKFHPLPLNGDQFDDWKKLKLCFSPAMHDSGKKWKVNEPILKYLQTVLKLQDSKEFKLQIPKIWAAVICFPHIDGGFHTPMPAHLMDLYRRLLLCCIDELIDDNVAFLLCQVVETMLLIMPQETQEVITFEEIENLLKRQSDNIFFLKIADLFCTCTFKHGNPFGCKKFLDSVFSNLLPNLSSPFHQVRFLTLRIFTPISAIVKNEATDQNVLKICLDAESVELNVHEYRERLKHLDSLEYAGIHSSLKSPYETVPLYYLLGTLYVNFQPLWEPTIKLIASYARGMTPRMFWNVFLDHLKKAAGNAEKALQDKYKDLSKTDSSNSDDTNLGTMFSTQQLQFGHNPERVDHANHRELLWKAMGHFSDMAESKNRELSPLFLQFVKNEYYQIQFDEAVTVDVKTTSQSEVDEMEIKTEGASEAEDAMSSSDSESDKDDDVQVLTPQQSMKPRKHGPDGTMKTLCTHLALFSKFKNPRFVFREPELYALYLQLLMHPSSVVQRLALNCIATYNYKYLMPYKENLFRLLDEKTFKTEIVLFSIDSESSVIVEEHRTGVIPILMRILFGKMQKRSGSKTKGKEFFLMRRKTILHFLANSQEDELRVFLDLAFLPLQQYTDGDILPLIEDIFSSCNFTSIVPPRRQLGILKLLGVVFEKLGHRITSYLPWLFKMLLSVSARVAVLLENRDKVNPFFLNVLKEVRQLAIEQIMQFFKSFENYPFSKKEIDSMFLAAVWPQLPRLAYEGVYSPTGLLKLFHHWSTNPRYFILLAKHRSGNSSISPLHQMMELLLTENVKLQPSVTSMIFEILENLLTLEDYNPSPTAESEQETKWAAFNEGPTIQVNDCLTVNRDDYRGWKEPPNYGTLIVLPHLNSILTKLKLQIKKLGIGKRSKKTIPGRTLIILSRLSEFVVDSAGCTELATLLIPFLSRRLSRSEDVEVNIFTIVRNLLKLVDDPKQFIKPLAGLFGSQNNRRSRAALCEAFAAIAQRDKTVSSMSNLVSLLNAWDARRPEEPDFKSRLAGFQLASEAIEKQDFQNPMLHLLIINNCCHCIRTIEDLSLRDNASHCMQNMVTLFGTVPEKDTAFVNSIMASTLLPEVRKGIKAKSEVVRREFIKILAACARGSAKSGLLSELHQLKNEELDLDFFENITHIQLHRRSRAMTRLISGDLCKDFSCNTLVNYILPIASSFLFNETYAKCNHLVDAAIELTGYICKYLNWRQYEKVLTFYLEKLPRNEEYQKVAVRIVVAVLDAFHFDLSVSKEKVGLKAPISFEKPKPESEVLEESTLEDAGETGDNDEFPDIPDAEESRINAGTEDPAAAAALATKIHGTIINKILPQLHKCLTKKAPKDESHNLANHYYPEDDEILRVPVAIAMVKLLQHLPKGALEKSLPGVLMKICTFLKSRSNDIRKIARQTLLTIMDSLGANFLPYLIKDMSHILTRGYQVHVMTFTLNAVLNQMKPRLKPGDLDPCLHDLIAICHNELFGVVAEEKEVQQILSKIPEAKSTKAYGTYEIMANFISSSCLPKLIFSLKEVLATTTNHASVRKMRECLRLVVQGLVENNGLSSKDFLIYSHAAVNEYLPNLSKTREKVAMPEIKPHQMRPDSFLIPKEPGRNKAVIGASQRTNAHIVVEFGLQLLYFALKRSRVDVTDQEALEMLDPFIPLLTTCLHSPHINLITSSLRNLTWLLKCPLPSLSKNINELAAAFFTILKKYSHSGMAQGSTCDMIVSCFKAVTILIRYVKLHTIDDNQLRILLLYVEQDINDHTRQTTAFTLLKVILARKLEVPEIHDVMKNIMEKSIMSENEHIRIQCRQCTLTYLLDYPLGKKLIRLLEFILAQLNYKEETGRESALEMLTSIFTTFPERMLSTNAGLFFIPMATALSNDESTKCRQMIAMSIKILLEKVSVAERTKLFSIVHTWLQDEKVTHRKLAANLVGLFVEVEKEKFQTRLSTILPILTKQLEPSKQDNIHEVAVQRKSDHLLFHALTAFTKILQHCDVLRKQTWCKELNQMWEYTQRHLQHPHTWVNLLTCQMYGLLFAAYPEDELVALITNVKRNDSEYFLQNFADKVTALSRDFLSQLRVCHLVPQIEPQIAKNMVYLAKIVNRLPKKFRMAESQATTSKKDGLKGKEMASSDESVIEEIQVFEISVPWLIKKFRREATHEIVNSPKVTLKRTCFFKWVAAIASDLKKEDLKSHLPLVLPILLREVSGTSTSDDPLKLLVQQILDLLSNLVGIQFFSQEYAAAQTKLNEKKAFRKRKKAIQAVTDPQVSARKKIKKHALQTMAHKRKQASYVPGKKMKKPRLKDLAFTV